MATEKSTNHAGAAGILPKAEALRPEDELDERKWRADQALALFPLLRPPMEKALRHDKAARVKATALLETAEAELHRSSQAQDLPTYRKSVEEAREALAALPDQLAPIQCQDDANVVWGLIEGIASSLRIEDAEAGPQQGEETSFALKNEEQVRLVIDEMTITAHLLRNHLRENSEDPTSDAMHVGARLAAQIGVLGDLLLEGNVVGDVSQWFIAQDFEQRGVQQ